MQTRRTFVPNCDNRVVQVINIEVSCLTEYNTLIISNLIITTLAVETIKLDHVHTRVLSINSVTLSRNSQRGTSIYSTRFYDDVIDPTNEGGVGSTRGSIRKNCKVVHCNIFCSSSSTNLYTIEVCRIYKGTKSRFFLNQNNVMPCLRRHCGEVGRTHRYHGSTTTTLRGDIEDNFTEVRITNSTIDRVDNLIAIVGNTGNHFHLRIIASMAANHLDPHADSPVVIVVKVSPIQTTCCL